MGTVMKNKEFYVFREMNRADNTPQKSTKSSSITHTSLSPIARHGVEHDGPLVRCHGGQNEHTVMKNEKFVCFVR